jgi:hypothetical protein
VKRVSVTAAAALMLLLLALAMLPVTAAFGQQQQQQEQGWLTYEHPHGFKVSYPADWVRYDAEISVIFEDPESAAS